MPGAGLLVDELAATPPEAEHLLLQPVPVPGQDVQPWVHASCHAGDLGQVCMGSELVRQEFLSVKLFLELESVLKLNHRPHYFVLLHPAKIISHLSPHLGLHLVQLLIALPLDGQAVLVLQDEGALPLVEPLYGGISNKEQFLHELPEPSMFRAPRLFTCKRWPLLKKFVIF